MRGLYLGFCDHVPAHFFFACSRCCPGASPLYATIAYAHSGASYSVCH